MYFFVIFAEVMVICMAFQLYSYEPTSFNNKQFALMQSAEYCSVDVFKALLELGTDPSINHNYALRHSSKNGCLDIVKLLIKDPRVNLNDLDGSPLLHAVANDHIEIVKMLLEDTRIDPTLGNFRILNMGYNLYRNDIMDILVKDPRIQPNIKYIYNAIYSIPVTEEDKKYAQHYDL